MSYGLFAVVTIIIGALVGLILVCIIDLIWPQKPMERQTFSQVQEREKLTRKSNEMINDDDLVDDSGAVYEDDESSDAEKNSGSDDEDEEEEEEVKEPSPKSSPDVRKRRTRKAD